MKKRHSCLLLLLFLVLGYVSQTSYAQASSAELLNIWVNDNRVEENQPLVLRTNLIDIEINYINAVSIKVGTVSKTVEESVYENTVYFDDYLLKPGLNTLTIEAKGSANTVIKKTFTINCLLSFLPGTTFVSEIPSTGKISAFEKSVNLTFPKGWHLVYPWGRPASVQDQRIVIETRSLGFTQPPSNFHTLVSNTILVTPEHYYLPSSSGTISIKYHDNVPEFSASTLTIMYFDGGSWINVGAIVDAKNRTATTTFDRFGLYGVFNASRFFEDYNWARVYAEPLWAKGIMKIRDEAGRTVVDGIYPEGKLGLSEQCKRVDFTSMIVRALGLPAVNIPETSRFSDINELHPEDVQDIETAAAYGIVEGVKVNEFSPETSLTRAQAAVLVSRVLNLPLVIDENKVAAELKKVFKDENDFNSIPDWARPHVLACVKAKYIDGIPKADGTGVEFQARSTLTRAQASKLIYLIAKNKKRI